MTTTKTTSTGYGERGEELFQKYVNGTISDIEFNELKQYCRLQPELREKMELIILLHEGIVENELKKMKSSFDELEKKINNESNIYSKRNDWNYAIAAAAVLIFAVLVYTGYQKLNEVENHYAEEPETLIQDTLNKKNDSVDFDLNSSSHKVFDSQAPSKIILQRKLAIINVDVSETESFGFATPAKIPSNIKIQYEPTFDGNEFYSIKSDTLQLFVTDSVGVAGYKVFLILEDQMKYDGLYLYMRSKYYKFESSGFEADGSEGEVNARRERLIPVSKVDQAEIDKIISEN